MESEFYNALTELAEFSEFYMGISKLSPEEMVGAYINKGNEYVRQYKLDGFSI